MTLDEAAALHRSGDLRTAEAAYREILSARESVGALANLASILRVRGDEAGALDLLHQALKIAPSQAALHLNLGNLHRDGGRPAEAVSRYAEALALDPSCDAAAVSLAEAKLAAGDFRDSWSLLQRRPARTFEVRRGFPFPEWTGQDLRGKRLLVWCEQGFGDQILMARFFSRLPPGAAVVCHKPLVRLLSQLQVDVVPWAEQVPVSGYDYWTLPMSLPAALRVGSDVATGPYFARSANVQVSARIGVAWRGNTQPDPRRSMTPDTAARLLELPGAISLQPEDTGAADFQATANIIADLDVVVSIDTSIAHLAGALGKPTILLHQYAPLDWRWVTARDGQSVWYPSVEVWRQPSAGDWNSLVERFSRRYG